MATEVKKQLSGKHKCFDVCWIAVDQMLPDPDETVLCCLESGPQERPKYQFMSLTDNGDSPFWCDHHGAGGDYLVTHWVPLACPPKNYKIQKAEIW